MKNYRENMTNKKGISMVSLIITIVVAITLASAGIVTVSNSISDATLTAFANDLNTIQDQVNLYYIQNDEFPVFDSETAFSQADIINLVMQNGNNSQFEEELTLNGDYNDNGAMGAFYKIDISKINVEQTLRGTKRDGDETDIYVVAYPSMNVYYLKGIKVKGVNYFSLSSKIVKYVKVESTENNDTSVTDLTTVGNISVKKSNKTWTNKLGINLNAYINSGESLYVNFGTEYKFNTNIGNNTFVFDTFETLKTKLVVSDATVYNNTVNNFIASADKKMKIYIKNSSGEQLDTMEIDLNNYDVVAPTADNFNVVESAENNILKFSVLDSQSGVKEIRYDYLQKYNEYGELEKYYTGVDSLDPYFLKARGKKSKVSKDGNVEISLPKEIEGIQIIVIDKAGNISLVTDEDGSQIPITKAITNDFYIGTTLKSINQSGLEFNVVFNLNTGVSGNLKEYTVEYSIDGETYLGTITKTIASSTNPYYETVSDYIDVVTIADSVYIKIVATTDTNVQRERIVKYSLSDGENIDYDDGEEVASYPIIPNGFEYLTGTVDTGYVIKNSTDGNEFVWVPVEVPQGKTFEETFVREAGYGAGSLQSWSTSSYIEPYGRTAYVDNESQYEYDAMVASVKKYGGFYMARYEASKNESTDKAQSVANQSPWVSETWNTIVQVARATYNVSSAIKERDAVSTLPYGVQWDATIRFLETNYPGIASNSEGYGWYAASAAGSAINTGSNADYELNHIFDMAGNVWEFTMETTNYSECVLRGGYWLYPLDDIPISYRKTYDTGKGDGEKGFRISLYVQ